MWEDKGTLQRNKPEGHCHESPLLESFRGPNQGIDYYPLSSPWAQECPRDVTCGTVLGWLRTQTPFGRPTVSEQPKPLLLQQLHLGMPTGRNSHEWRNPELSVVITPGTGQSIDARGYLQLSPSCSSKLFFVISSLPTSYKWCFHPKNDGTWEHASPGMQANQECRKTELWLCWIHRSKCTCLRAFLASVEETGGGNWLPPVPFL